MLTFSHYAYPQFGKTNNNWLLKGAQVISDGRQESADILIQSGKITAIGQNISTSDKETKVRQLSAETVIGPGLIEQHHHGAFGIDYNNCTPDGIRTVLKEQLKHGVTSVVPSIATSSLKEMINAIQVLKGLVEESQNDPKMATILGIGIEGPFLSQKKPGAHHVPTIKLAWHQRLPLLEKFVKAAGPNFIKWMTIAPEVYGAKKLINYLNKNNIRVMMGHTAIKPDAIEKVITSSTKSQKIAGITHFYNQFGEPAMLHRFNSPVFKVFKHPKKLYKELVLDGGHVAKEPGQYVIDQSDDHVLMVSDNMRLAGLPDGSETEMCQRTVVKRGPFALSEEAADAFDGSQLGVISGSAALMDDCVRVAVGWGNKLSRAVKMGSTNIANFLGLNNQIGNIQTELEADLTLWNYKDGKPVVKSVFNDGVLVFDKE